MSTVSAASVAANDESIEGLPEAVLEALGEPAGAAKEGLLALSVGVGPEARASLRDARIGPRSGGRLERPAGASGSAPAVRGSRLVRGGVRRWRTSSALAWRVKDRGNSPGVITGIPHLLGGR